MEITNISLVYFSATYSTRKVVRTIAKQIGVQTKEHDITQATPSSEIAMGEGDLLIVGMPVYAGRIPSQAVEKLQKFKGSETPAIIVCVYGNRDYDDALLEMKNIVEENGFKVVSAGAFIAQHSIFPAVGQKRPDEQDLEKIKAFADQSIELIKENDMASLSDIQLKGNMPYKIPGSIPLHPRTKRGCDKCGICVKLCPVQAIPADEPTRTIKEICISCGRCIVVCPQKVRHFGGILYKLAGSKFVKANSARKEPEVIFASNVHL